MSQMLVTRQFEGTQKPKMKLRLTEALKMAVLTPIN